jgi:hypothetical protein
VIKCTRHLRNDVLQGLWACFLASLFDQTISYMQVFVKILTGPLLRIYSILLGSFLTERTNSALPCIYIYFGRVAIQEPPHHLAKTISWSIKIILRDNNMSEQLGNLFFVRGVDFFNQVNQQRWSKLFLNGSSCIIPSNSTVVNVWVN